MNSQLLTPNDVAAYCQVSPKTVLRAIQSGRLSAVRLGVRGAYRVTETIPIAPGTSMKRLSSPGL